jgi:hypothetical protein
LPQVSKGGKYIYGYSLIRQGLSIQLPPRAMEEYDITWEGKIYLITGSKTSGGFVVTRKGLLLPSKIGGILVERPALMNYELAEGEFTAYKGRSYCWIRVSRGGGIILTQKTASVLRLEEGMALLCIRSSDIAFTMAAGGPLLEKAKKYGGSIKTF